LNQLQAELEAERPDLLIELHGVNGIGHESNNAAACAGKNLPWLQDDVTRNVWSAWQVTYRDVVILDDLNQLVTIYNLTLHDLGVPANYAELKALLIAAAGG
jgi:hypothetical protein